MVLGIVKDLLSMFVNAKYPFDPVAVDTLQAIAGCRPSDMPASVFLNNRSGRKGEFLQVDGPIPRHTLL